MAKESEDRKIEKLAIALPTFFLDFKPQCLCLYQSDFHCILSKAVDRLLADVAVASVRIRRDRCVELKWKNRI